jgi:hypothetical protein
MKKIMMLLFILGCAWGGTWSAVAEEAAPPCGQSKACLDQEKFLDINWNYVMGMGNYNPGNKDYTLDVSGVMMEAFWGRKIPSLENMKLGIAPSFFFATGTTDFSVDEPGVAQKWKAEVSSTAALLLAKYMLGASFGNLSVNFSNGVGLGYYDVTAKGKWRAIGDTSDTKVLSVYRGLLPAADLNLEIKFNISDYSAFGVGAGVNMVFLDMGDYTLPFLLKGGINYEVKF